MGYNLALLAVILLASSATVGTAVAGEAATPRAQMAGGAAAEEVVCETGLQLMIKNNGDAICVSVATAERLAEIGFATPVENQPIMVRDSDEMSDGAGDEMSDGTDYEMRDPTTHSDPENKVGDTMDAMHVDPTAHPMAEQVRRVALDAIDLYKADGTAAFETINTGAADLEMGQPYPFVIASAEFVVVANGFDPTLVGQMVYDIVTYDKTQDEILIDLENGIDTWVQYTFTNPDTGTEQLKKSVLYMYDDYVFGAGYYTDAGN